jgi:hypothetical protein
VMVTWEPRKEGETEQWFAWYPLVLNARRPPYTRYFIWLRRVQRTWTMTDHGTCAWHFEPPHAGAQ